MTRPVPLALSLGSPQRGRQVFTDKIQDLSFRKTIPGGYASATFELGGTIDRRRVEREALNDVIITDTRHAGVIWQGKLEDPGRAVDGSGSRWDMVAMGPSAHTRERRRPYVVVDRDLSHWIASDVTSGIEVSQENARRGSGTVSAVQTPTWVVRFPQGTTVGTSWRGVVTYPHLVTTGQKMGGLGMNWDTVGNNTGLFVVEVLSRTGVAGTGEGTTQSANGVLSGTIYWVIGNYPNGRNTMDMRFIYTGGATTIPGPIYECNLGHGAYVKALLLTKAGVERGNGPLDLTGLYGTRHYFRTHDVVEDLLGRWLNRYDGASAVVEQDNTTQVSQMAYLDGVDAAQVLDDLMLMNNDFYWAAWEGTPARFEWRRWPTTVRYEFSVLDGFQSPQSASEIYDRVSVRYLDEAGARQTFTATQTVPALSDFGVSRDAPVIDLADEVSTLGNAATIGAQFLAAHRTPSNNGSVVISRPVLDLSTGRMVMPHELEPGCLVRVKGFEGYADDLNPQTLTGEDGVTTFRMVATNYSTSSNSTTCELSSPALSLDQMLSDLITKRERKR